MQASLEDTFSNQTFEDVHVNDDVEKFWTQEVTTEDETADVGIKRQHIIETLVCIGNIVFFINWE